MFPAWRLKLREVQVAVDSQRYEEAIALLSEESLREFLPAKKLAQEVAGKMVARAGERFARGDSAAGWQDLAVAERLGGQGEAIGKLREEMAAATLEEVRRYLAAGQPVPAKHDWRNFTAKVSWARRAGCWSKSPTRCTTPKTRPSTAVSPRRPCAIERAKGLAAEAAAGEGTMEIARQLESQSREIAARQTEGQRLTAELHARLGEQDWSAVLSAAEAMLAIAPHHEAARQARRRAWKAVGMDVTHAMHRGNGVGQVSLDWNRAAMAAAGVRRGPARVRARSIR